jgi:hypothetical protein
LKSEQKFGKDEIFYIIYYLRFGIDAFAVRIHGVHCLFRRDFDDISMMMSHPCTCLLVSLLLAAIDNFQVDKYSGTPVTRPIMGPMSDGRVAGVAASVKMKICG